MGMAKRNGVAFRPADRWDVAYDRWVFGTMIEAGPVAMNLVSSGRCPIGRPVPLPAVLQRLPRKPPGKV